MIGCSVKKAIIEIPEQHYYGQRDEEMFFQWLDNISCVESYDLVGKTLYVTLSSNVVSLRDYLALEGLLKRYQQDPRKVEQLAVYNPPSAGGSVDDLE